MAEIFSDQFTGTNGDPPNPADWDVITFGGTSANAVEIQSNALELTTQSDNGQSTVAANCREAVGDLLDGGLECDVVLPSGTGHFFANLPLRINAARDEHYDLSIRRASDGGGITARIQKISVAGGTENVGDSIPLSGAVARWNVRFQVTGTGTPQLKAAVRDFSLGAIPAGAWDIQEVDDLASGPIGAGAAEAKLSEGGGVIKTMVVENFRVFDIDQAFAAATLPALSATGSGTVSGQGAGTPGTQIFSDDFTGNNGDPLDPSKWATYGHDTFVADIQGNRLRMDATGGDTVDSSDVTAVAQLPIDVADLTVELTVDFPPSGSTGEFYSTISTRMEPHTGLPIPDPSGYRLVLRRGGPTQQPSFRLVRNVGGVEDPISSTIQLSNSVSAYRVRYQTVGSDIRAAVRDASLGPIPDGSWDLEVQDTNVTQAGTIWIRYAKGDTAGSREIFYDDIRVFSHAGNLGVATFPALTAGGAGTVTDQPGGQAILPTLGASGAGTVSGQGTIVPPQFDAATEGYSAGTTQLVIPHTCSGANRYLRVGLMLEAGVSITSATYGGVPLAEVIAPEFPGSFDEALIELGLAGPAAGTHDVVINFDVSTEVWCGVVSYHTVDQATPTSGVAVNWTGSGRSLALNIASSASALVVGLAGTTSHGLTSGAGQTTRAIKAAQANGEFNALMDEEDGAAITQLDYSWTLNRFALVLGLSLHGAVSAVTGTGTAVLPALGVQSGAQETTSGAGTATLPALGAAGVANDAVFNDDFVGPDGSPPDPARWTLPGGSTGTFAVELEDNRLLLFADATSGDSNAEPIANVLVEDGQVDCAIEIPPLGTADDFFYTIGLRSNPSLPEEAYFIHVFRSPEGSVPRWRLQKYVDADNPPNTPLTATTDLSNAVLRYRVRLEVVDTTIRGSVRPFDDGPIPAGVWDKTATDSAITGPGNARPNFTKLNGAASAYVDSFQVFDLDVAAVVAGAGSATFPALAANGAGRVVDPPPATGTGQTTLPALAALGTGTVAAPGPATGTGNAVMPAFAVAGVGNQAKFNDDFVGPDGTAPDPARWDVYGTGTFLADRQDNRLRLDASGGTGTGSSNANAVAKLPSLITHVRAEFDVVLPPTGPTGEFFFATALRIPPHTEQQNPEPPAYRLLIFRNGTTAPIEARIIKESGGVSDPLTGDLSLGNNVLHYRVRWEADGEDLRAAVREFDLGPIDEGDWDFETTDPDFTNAGTVRPRLVKGDAAGSREILIDHFQVFDLAAPGPNEVVGTGTAGFPALVASGDGMVIPFPGQATGTAVLPALTARQVNLVPHPEDFSQWNRTGPIPPGAPIGGQPDPFGGNNAWLLVSDQPENQQFNQLLTAFSSDGDKGFSLFLKEGPNPPASGTRVFLRGEGDPVENRDVRVEWDADGNAVVSETSPITTLLDVKDWGGGWWRIRATAEDMLVAGEDRFCVNITYATGQTGDVYVFGATAHDQPIPGAYGGGGLGAVVVAGTGTVTLPALGGSGAAAAPATGTAAVSLPALLGSGSAQLVVRGTGAAVLPALAGSGTSSSHSNGVGTAELPALVAAGAGIVPVAGTGSATLPGLEATGAATFPVLGTGTAVLPALVGSGSSALRTTGVGAVDLPTLGAVGQARAHVAGTGSATFPALTATGTGQAAAGGHGDARLPALTADGAGVVLVTGQAVAVLPALTGSGTTRLFITGAATAVLPALQVQGTALVNPPVEAFDLDVRVRHPINMRVSVRPASGMDVNLEPGQD